MDSDVINLLYIVAFSLFIIGLAQLTSPTTAVRGNRTAAVGMAVAVIATLLREDTGNWGLIALGIVIGTVIGVPAARNVKMTAMPQMVALFNGVGGGAIALIAWAEFREQGGDLTDLEVGIPLVFAAIVGSISFWGSNIAFGKLQELISGRPLKLPGGVFINGALLIIAIAAGVVMLAGSDSELALHRPARRRRRARRAGRAADRRRGHAGRHLHPERLHRAQRRRGRCRAGQHRA